MIQEKCDWKIIRTDPDAPDFNIYKLTNQIHIHIGQSTKKSTKKSLIDYPSNKLLEAAIYLKSKCKKVGSNFIKKLSKMYCQSIKMTGKKKKKWTPNQKKKKKKKDTYCVSCKKYTGNGNMSSKRIKNKVKLLKTKCRKYEHNKPMFLKQIHK